MANPTEPSSLKIALDLCCGKGGGTQAFRGQPGWHVVGVDSEKKFAEHWVGENMTKPRSNNAIYHCVECGDKFPHVEEARLCARIDRLERKQPMLEKKE